MSVNELTKDQQAAHILSLIVREDRTMTSQEYRIVQGSRYGDMDQLKLWSIIDDNINQINRVEW